MYLNPGLGEDGAGGEDEEAVEQRVEGIKDCDVHNVTDIQRLQTSGSTMERSRCSSRLLVVNYAWGDTNKPRHYRRST